jgi:hypothetical protein
METNLKVKYETSLETRNLSRLNKINGPTTRNQPLSEFLHSSQVPHVNRQDTTIHLEKCVEQHFVAASDVVMAHARHGVTDELNEPAGIVL